MRLSIIARLAITVMMIVAISLQSARLQASVAEELPSSLTKYIPQKPDHTLTGSEFVALTSKMSEQQREKVIGEQVLSGNIPDFLRELKPVKLQTRDTNGRLISATIFVTPDYLAIGSENDFIRTPMDFHTASLVASRLGFILPTRKMVDAIYNQSENHFTPQPMQPGAQMRSTDYYQRHNQKIDQQQESLGITSGELVSGHKKDVVITNKLMNKPGRIAIYGWHQPNGKPIQPLSTVHGAGYADYSHGVRLVSETVIVDGELCSVYDILKDPDLAPLLSDEGPIVAGYSPDNVALPAGKKKSSATVIH
ncbi:hypothetical protein [Desulfosediminicola sp.]|uniref:hypothetical protein n=1 Tax=Desulfosediminicola sp. TaxID=2886825 RepID=UPI003AF1EF68